MTIEPVRVVSFGGGVQTTALAILNAHGEVPNPTRMLVMADTGGEHPETYAYVEQHFRPWAEAHDVTLYVTSHHRETLEAEALRRRMVPTVHTRWCTQNHKIRVLRRWFREHGATRQQPADVQVGISADESHRAVSGWPVGYEQRRWPLVEMGITRNDCAGIIAGEGLPVPPKSGCWFCPFQPQGQWRLLAIAHPDLWERALVLEQNARLRKADEPGLLSSRGSIAMLVAGGLQLPLGWDALLVNDQGCRSGACFV